MAKYADGTHQKGVVCRQCGKRKGQGQHISARGLCTPCSKRNVREAMVQLRKRRGPIVERQLRAQIETAQRQLDAL
jgi:hypothetical protein